MGSAASALGRAVALAIAIGWAVTANAASSRDYPGPCTGEVNAGGVPLYLAADYRGQNPAFGVVILGNTGRFKLGISCVGTGFVVVRVGPDSALCTVRGLCTPDQLQALSENDIEAVRSIPNQVPFFHICRKHGFGWYDATNVPAGIYLAIAKSASALWGFVEGHGTMDTYAFVGSGGNFQPVNCPRPPTPVCGNFIVDAGETCDDGNRVDGDCCSSTCSAAPPGTPCPGNGDLCSPGTCNGTGACMAGNACIDEPVDGAKLLLQRKNGKEKLLWRAKNHTPVETGAAFDPTVSGATLELFSPNVPPVSIALEAAGWTARGPGAYKYKGGGSSGLSGIRAGAVLRGRSIKVVGRWAGFSLNDPLIGVGIRLVGGTLATCSLFPGSTVVSDAPGIFAARGPTPLLAHCDRATLGQGTPPGGDLNPGLPPDPPDPGDPGGGWCTGVMICPILPILE